MMLVEIILHLGRTCDDSKWVGDVVRAVCGQKVKLDRGQTQIVSLCRAGIAERNERREHERIRKAKSRARSREAAK